MTTGQRTHRREQGEVSLMASVLTDTPKLSGARCIEAPRLFDPRDRDEAIASARARHRAAIRLCADCPSVGLCRTWALTQPSDQRRHVVGGMQPRLAGEHTTHSLPKGA